MTFFVNVKQIHLQVLVVIIKDVLCRTSNIRRSFIEQQQMCTDVDFIIPSFYSFMSHYRL